MKSTGRCALDEQVQVRLGLDKSGGKQTLIGLDFLQGLYPCATLIDPMLDHLEDVRWGEDSEEQVYH